jgi:hypothetical protein
MAPPAKRSAKANVDTSKHDILSFFGSARGATSSSKPEEKSKEALTPKETKAKTKTKTKTKVVESEDPEGGEAKPKFKCATL